MKSTKRFYFTLASTAAEVGHDHIGNIRGARSKAQKIADKTHETVFINDIYTESIVECVYPMRD